MSMLTEIEKLMNDVDTSFAYRVINLGGNSVYIEGIKSVVGLSETDMQFQLKKQVLIVSGTNLKLGYLDKSTCVIKGNIIKVEVQ